MKIDKKRSEAAANFKLKKRAGGDLKKEDLSEVVKIGAQKVKPKTFTLRLSEEEQQELRQLVEEMNHYASFKKISANDVLRGLIYYGSKINAESLVKIIKTLP